MPVTCHTTTTHLFSDGFAACTSCERTNLMLQLLQKKLGNWSYNAILIATIFG